MKMFGLAFIILGIFLISLSGLEKVLIYTALFERAPDMEILKNITPNYIWNIANNTLILGIIFFISGSIMITKNHITNHFKRVKGSCEQEEEATKPVNMND
ncbi:hypothetical protein [Paenibacillus dakarensis]|uniref:hypothetical protein n=1 Tax=Paenibacillus dakarensis TaxID=1527293 RepID=UPI0006D596CD|nr:hypothetical protein [Paenibacillus dakarensis]